MLSAVLLTLTGSLLAQFSFGVRGGIGLFEQSIEFDGGDISTEKKLGLVLAALAEIPVAGDFAIQPEIAFIQKGGKSDTEDINGDKTTFKTTLNHVEVPLLAKYKFGSESVSGFVLAGPSFGYALSGSSEEDGDKHTFEDEDWEGYNRLEISAQLGGGVGFNAGSGQLFIDLRYILSLNNLSDEDELTARNKGFSVTLGYLFGMGE